MFEFYSKSSNSELQMSRNAIFNLLVNGSGAERWWNANYAVYPLALQQFSLPSVRVCGGRLAVASLSLEFDLCQTKRGSSAEIQMTAAATPLPLCCSKAGFFELRTVAPDWRNLFLVVVLTQKSEVNFKCSFFDKVPIEQWICQYFYGYKDSRIRVQVRKSKTKIYTLPRSWNFQ